MNSLVSASVNAPSLTKPREKGTGRGLCMLLVGLNTPNRREIEREFVGVEDGKG